MGNQHVCVRQDGEHNAETSPITSTGVANRSIERPERERGDRDEPERDQRNATRRNITATTIERAARDDRARVRARRSSASQPRARLHRPARRLRSPRTSRPRRRTARRSDRSPATNSKPRRQQHARAGPVTCRIAAIIAYAPRQSDIQLRNDHAGHPRRSEGRLHTATTVIHEQVEEWVARQNLRRKVCGKIEAQSHQTRRPSASTVGVSTASCTPERNDHDAYTIATTVENNRTVRFGGKSLV